MLTLFVEGVGLRGPGLESWHTASPVLAGRNTYAPGPFVPPALDVLPPAERRRVSVTVKLALSIAQEAVKGAGRDAKTLASVFASSGGDGDTIHNILQTLATSPRDISPTRFHNSVHNAPSGYWTLATECREPSTTIGAYDWSFGAGLLEAAALASADERPVLLVAYDIPYPEPLYAARPMIAAFGVALVLSPTKTPAALTQLQLRTLTEPQPESRMTEALEALRLGNPAARSLPLLAALARAEEETVTLEASPGLGLGLTITGLGAG